MVSSLIPQFSKKLSMLPPWPCGVIYFSCQCFIERFWPLFLETTSSRSPVGYMLPGESFLSSKPRYLRPFLALQAIQKLFSGPGPYSQALPCSPPTGSFTKSFTKQACAGPALVLPPAAFIPCQQDGLSLFLQACCPVSPFFSGDILGSFRTWVLFFLFCFFVLVQMFFFLLTWLLSWWAVELNLFILVLSRCPLADHYLRLSQVIARKNIHLLLGSLTGALSSRLTVHFGLLFTPASLWTLSFPGLRTRRAKVIFSAPWNPARKENGKGPKMRGWQFVLWVTARALIRQEVRAGPMVDCELVA